ncbi:MAG: hypothetical protein IJ289_00700 [Clostridia bacterium]|nr:hypothetical protein [Clostridia bacterium]
MKKIAAILMVIITLVSVLCACGDSGNKNNNSVVNTTEAVEEQAADSTDNIKIDGLFVDESYVVEEGSSLKLLYLFYTLTATDANLEIDSKYTYMTIGANKYESGHIPGVAKNMSSYVYTSYIEDVYVGESLKVVATFKVPAADLAPGKTIALEDSQLPNEEKLELITDSIQFKANTEEIAKVVDPEGYAAEQGKLQPADDERKSAVVNEVNGYEWSFYVNSTSYKISFTGNGFTLTTAFGSNSGTYEVLNGYIVCTYPNGNSVKIPYEIVDGEVDIDFVAGFDVKEG